jgi:RNA polymerase-binding transcription factor
MDDALINELRQALLQRLDELNALRADASEARGTVALDQTSVGRLSRMDALQGQQMALAQDRNREVEISRIEAAVQRMDDDAYGYCLKCDEEIAERRLRFDPAAPMCIDCAK